MKTVTAGILGESVGANIIGESATPVRGANPLSDCAPGDITLLEDSSKIQQVVAAGAAAVVVSAELPQCELVQLVVEDVHQAFSQIVQQFRKPEVAIAQSGVSPAAHVDPSCSIAEGASVGPGCVIGADVEIGPRTRLVSGVTIMSGCRIGADVTLYPGVVLYENTVIEDRVWIHAGSVIGAYGFGYRQSGGEHVRTAQLGFVHIEQDVEIGAGATIDRGTYGATRIGQGTKIDNQVMIAHNCHIGKRNLICSQVGIAGSCSTGDYVVLAGQVGLKDHIALGDGVIVGAQAGVMNDCESGKVYLGSPASPQKEQMQIFAMWRRLPELRKSVKRLEQTVSSLQQDQAQQSESRKAA